MFEGPTPRDEAALTHAEIERCAQIFKLLGTPTRLELFLQVATGPATVTQLAQRLSLDRSLVSHHLDSLDRAGLVEFRAVGANHIYSPSGEVVVERDGGTARILIRRFSAIGVRLDLGAIDPSASEAKPRSRALADRRAF